MKRDDEGDDEEDNAIQNMLSEMKVCYKKNMCTNYLCEENILEKYIQVFKCHHE